MLDTQANIIGHNSRMTEEEYAVERAKIAATKAEAGVHWQQVLAALFHRSGWAVEELARREGKTARSVNASLKFGQFLAFCKDKSGPFLSEILPLLSENRFNGYWQQVRDSRKDKRGLYLRERFGKILRLMEEEYPTWTKSGVQPGRKKLPATTSSTVIKKCSGPKWRSAAQIAAKADIPVERIPDVIHQLRTRQQHKAAVETKKVGKETHYRIFSKEKTVSLEELTEKLTPIIKGLEVEGKKHVAQRVEAEIARLTFRLKRLLDEWAE
jgi:hypothetical protein